MDIWRLKERERLHETAFFDIRRGMHMYFWASLLFTASIFTACGGKQSNSGAQNKGSQVNVNQTESFSYTKAP